MADPETDLTLDTTRAMNANENYLTQVNAIRRTMTPARAQETSDFVRTTPGISPDSAAAFMTLGWQRDNPQIAEIVRRDYTQQGGLMGFVNKTLGVFTRNATAGFYDMWDLSTSRWLRFGVQTYQNPTKNPVENLARAGTGIIGEAVQAVDSGESSIAGIVFGNQLGTGLIAGRPDDPLELPGAGSHLENQLKEGVPLDEALSNTEEWALEKYGANIVHDAWAIADATRMHVTVNGLEYDYGVSAGRMLATPMFQIGYLTPGTVPANIITGGIDFYTQIAMDPIDPLFDAATRWFSVRNALRPGAMSTVDQAIAAHGGILLEAQATRGPYYKGNDTGISADGYVFFGGGAWDETTGYQGGGISLNIERALKYAKDSGTEGRVYAIKIEDLQPHLQKHVEEVGDIEEFVDMSKLSPADEIMVDDLTVQINGEEFDALRSEEAFAALKQELRDADPEYNAFMERSEKFDYQANHPYNEDGTVNSPNNMDFPGHENEYIATYFTETEAARYADAMNDAYKKRRAFRDSVQRAKALNHSTQVAIGDGLNMGTLNKEFVPGDFPVPIEGAFPIKSVEDMLVDGYFYPGGEEARAAAKNYIDNDLGVVQQHGRWVAKTPEQFLESKKGKNFVHWLASPGVYLQTKMRHLIAMGVPNSAAWGLIDDLDAAIKAADEPAAAFVEPARVLNDYEIETAFGNPASGVDTALDNMRLVREDITNLGRYSESTMDQLRIGLSEIAKRNPQLSKRIMEVQRHLDVVEGYKATNVPVEDAMGLLDRKLSELGDNLKKLRTEDVEKIEAARIKHASRPPTPKAIEEANKHVTNWVNNQLVTRQSRAPMMGRKLHAGESAIAGESVVKDTPRSFSDWGRRWKAHSTSSEINMWDWNTTFDTVTQFLDTIGSHPADIARIVRLSRANFGNFHGSAQIVDELLLELEKSLARKGVDESAVQRIINEYLGEQRRTTAYQIDRAGNKIGEVDSVYTLERTPGGLKFRVLYDQPINDAEMTLSSIHVPSVREARRITSPTRTLVAKHFGYPITLAPSTLDRMIDIAAATWRNFQLLRPGWMMSVVPDEMARAAAQGHAALLSNPMFAWNIMMQKTGNVLPSGNLLDEIIEMQGGYGTGGAMGARSATDEPLLMAHAGDTSWEVVEALDEAGEFTPTGAEHVARQWVRLYQSQILKAVYDHEGSIEDAVTWLTTHPDGLAVLDNITTGQGRGALPSPRNRLGRLNVDLKDPEQLKELQRIVRLQAEALDAQLLLMNGGDWIRRNPDPNVPGGWLNSGGDPVQTYDGVRENGRLWTKQDLIDEVRRLDKDARGTRTVGGKDVTKADLKARLLQEQGINIDLRTVLPTQTYVTIKRGDRNITNIVGMGKAEREIVDVGTASTYALNRRFMEAGIHQEDAVVISVANDSFDGHNISGEYVVRINTRRNAQLVISETDKTHIVVDKSKLTPEQHLNIMEALRNDEPVMSIDLPFGYEPKAMRRIDATELGTSAEELRQAGDVPRIFNEMDGDDLDNLVDYVRTQAYPPGVAKPKRIMAPSRATEARLDGQLSFVDRLFSALGAKPSIVAARSPYSRVRVWETFADYYLYATPQLRTQIRKAAAESGIPAKQFDAFVERSMRIAGFKPTDMPSPAATQLTLAEIEKIAVAKAIQDTRDLFFDLTKRGNWADASKLIFPFGDAWWEVLTRWGALFNPLKAEEFGRPFKNLHRLQQAEMGAERSGWFETNERGQRTFKWFPGAAMATELLNNPDGFKMTNVAAMNQVTFIDFSDTRALLMPGMGPYLQMPAAGIRPLEGTIVQSWIDWAVFGSFDPGEIDAEGVKNSLFPTYLRKGWEQVAGGQYDEKAASLTTDIANTLFATGDPQYANMATDQAVMQKLILDARGIAETYLWVDILVAFIAPLQPKAVTQLVNTTTEGTERIIQLASVADDFNFLNNYMTHEVAMQTVIDWYGPDPTMIAPKSYGVLRRPMTESFHNFAINHEEEMKLLPYTIAAFGPIVVDEPFYSQEYQRQIAEGERQKLTPDEAFLYLSYRQGQARMQEVQDEKDRRLLEAEFMWAKDSEKYREYRDETVFPWYANAKMSLEAMYFGYKQGQTGPAKIRKRPGSEELLGEMLQIGTVGSPLNLAAREMDPRLTALLEETARWWGQNNDMSILAGHDVSWWYSSDSQTDPTTSQMREVFTNRVDSMIGRIDDNDLKHRYKWYTDAVVTPLMQGYDLDSPFIVDVDPLLAPEG